MAKWGSDDGFVLIDGYDLAGVSTDLEDSVEAMTEDEMGIGDSWPEPAYVGLKQWGLTQNGFYDDAANSMNAALVSSTGAARVSCWGREGNTVGKKFTGAAGATQVDYRRVISRGALHKGNASYQGSGQVDEGVILHELSAETADGDTEGADSVDNGASSANGGAGYLQVTALSLGGHTNLTAKVRHSADDITYADLITFTAVTAAPAAERKTVAGTVNRYLATSWDFTGAGSGPTGTFLIGFARA